VLSELDQNFAGRTLLERCRKFFPTTATAVDKRMDLTAVAKYGEAQAMHNA